MKAKILLYALPALIFTIIHLAEAQQAKKTPRIGLLNFGPAEHYRRQQHFLAGLRDLGWVEGENIAIERRYANESRNQLLDIAAELVRLRVDVIVAVDSVAIRPAMQATRTIPIVMVVSGDPVEAGLIDSLARPGGNVTGLSNVSPQLAGKQLELLKETVPGVSKVAVLGPPTHEDWKEMAFAALQQKVRLQTLPVREPEEFEKAFEAARTKRAKALIVLPSSTTNYYPEKIVSLAAKYRLPAMYGLGSYVTVGGLMSYAPSLRALFRRTAYYVDRILMGVKPADLPVEQPTKFDLVINLKTAEDLGLTIPPLVLMRAEKVIK